MEADGKKAETKTDKEIDRSREVDNVTLITRSTGEKEDYVKDVPQ